MLLVAAFNANYLALEAAGKSDVRTTPKLVIGIAVDQLRTDYIYALENRLSEGGFKRLLQQGLVYEQVMFDIEKLDATAALAVLATGSQPFNNGVTGQEVYDAQMLRRQSVFYDKDYIGNNTDAHFSPRALISTTLADELKTASFGKSRIFSIAPDPESAIIGAGHASDGAFWLDEKKGQWVSTSFYKEFPQVVTRKNGNKPLSVLPSEADWYPTLWHENTLDIMPFYPEGTSFNHSFYQYGQPCYDWIKTSPIINDAIVDLAENFIKAGNIGKGKSCDMLQLTLYAGTFKRSFPEVYAAELQDIYLRLDQSLKNLLDFIDNQIGLENTFLYLYGTGQTLENTSDVEGMKSGIFTASRCKSLLNSFLISQYGQGQWVVDFHNNQIYLDHRFIDNKGLNLAEVQKAAAEFVMMFSGVEDVATQHQILHEDFSDRIHRLRKSYNRVYGGDLVLTLQPGWSFRADDNSEIKPQIRHDIAPGPAILFSPNLQAERITTPVPATAIAPTVANQIRIRAPSGCKEMPLLVK